MNRYLEKVASIMGIPGKTIVTERSKSLGNKALSSDARASRFNLNKSTPVSPAFGN